MRLPAGDNGGGGNAPSQVLIQRFTAINLVEKIQVVASHSAERSPSRQAVQLCQHEDVETRQIRLGTWIDIQADPAEGLIGVSGKGNTRGIGCVEKGSA